MVFDDVGLELLEKARSGFYLFQEEFMRKQLPKILTGLLLAGALAMPVIVSAVPQPQREEPHPVIRESIAKVENARHDLVAYAAHDFDGHRAKAIAHLDEALKELHLALDADRH